ncbi:Protein phosphatase 2C [Seinonella peptonophila]|uniref:Protein phosphatase 2C n=1 Tax=Seinonella peptonophila TaxID=112248 RepID=A0A1M4VQ25_9BACL|nr:protein phosphatase 2C domain-containing protein [Seinonella peptonophila]SHE71154.1 Protein phosphatase 2C [Seinonella peptonophila]
MLNYRLEGLSIQNSNPQKPIEDAYVVTSVGKDQEVIAVLDGATGRYGLSGKIASETFQQELETMQEKDTLLEVLERANQKLASKAIAKFEELIAQKALPADFIEQYRSIQETDPQEIITKIDPAYSTSTAGVIIKIDRRKDEMELVQTGDCMAIAKMEDGQIQPLTKDHVAKSDLFSYHAQQIARDQLMKEQNIKNLSNLSTEEYQAFQSEVQKRMELTLKTGRRNANHTGSSPISGGAVLLSNEHDQGSSYAYPIFNGVPIDLTLHHQTIPLKNINELLLLSDGLVVPQPRIGADGWQLAGELVFNEEGKGLNSLLEIVQLIETIDPRMEYFKDRVKPDDDKTAIHLCFERSRSQHPLQTKLQQRAEADRPTLEVQLISDRDHADVTFSYQTR